MVRSVSPHAYPTIYFRMLEAFAKTPLPFHITCKDRNEAFNRRNEWLSFIKAIERQTKNEKLIELSKIGRGRKCSVTGPNETILVWASRDLDSFNENLEEQLDEFEAQLKTEHLELTVVQTTNKSSIPMLSQHPANEPPTVEETLDEFLSTSEENDSADEIFKEFLSETDEAINEVKDDEGINSLLNAPLKPIKTIVTFSRESTTEDGTEGQI